MFPKARVQVQYHDVVSQFIRNKDVAVRFLEKFREVSQRPQFPAPIHLIVWKKSNEVDCYLLS